MRWKVKKWYRNHEPLWPFFTRFYVCSFISSHLLHKSLVTQWPCSDSINLGRSPFASPSTELTWRAQHRTRTRLSVEWKWLLSPWSMWHFWGRLFSTCVTIKRCPKSLVIHVNLESYPNPNSPPNLWKSLKTCRFRGVNGNHGKCWDSTESGVLFTSHFQRLVTSLPSSSLTARAAWASRSERQ